MPIEFDIPKAIVFDVFDTHQEVAALIDVRRAEVDGHHATAIIGAHDAETA